MGAGGSKTRVEVTDPYKDHKEARRLSKFASEQLAPLPNPALPYINDDDDEQASPGTACPNASTGGSTDASAAALPLLLKPTDGATDTAVVPAIESADDEAGAAVRDRDAGHILSARGALTGRDAHLVAVHERREDRAPPGGDRHLARRAEDAMGLDCGSRRRPSCRPSC